MFYLKIILTLLLLPSGILAHTPGLYYYFPGYPMCDDPDDPYSTPAATLYGGEAPGTCPGGEYSLYCIINLLPNFGVAFTSMSTEWMPIFRLVGYLVTSALAVAWDSPLI